MGHGVKDIFVASSYKEAKVTLFLIHGKWHFVMFISRNGKKTIRKLNNTSNNKGNKSQHCLTK